jgi:hypothetical protein
MKDKTKQRAKLIIIGMLPVFILINAITKSTNTFIEKVYSTGINKPIRQLLSLIFGIFPFSVAELLVIALFGILFYMIILLVINIKKGGALQQLLNIGTYLASLYILFLLLWGFNYNRLPFDKIIGITVQKSSKEELYNLCSSLIQRANLLRLEVEENKSGVMMIPGGYEDIFKRAPKGYEAAAKEYPVLGGKYGPPKKIFLSEPMTYTGITGIYIPYTGESNVNINTRDFKLPATTAHEMAHQRGFSREDEANYIAYLTCSMHPDVDFQYSGTVLALIYSMNALQGVDIDGYYELRDRYSDGLNRDLKDDNEFWSKYEGKVQEISNKINDTYLKSNGQQDGVASYGRMVDLLLAEQREKKQ